VLLQLASFKLGRQDTKGAERLLKRALSLNPDPKPATSRRVFLAARKGDLQTASPIFREAVRINRVSAGTAINHANTLAQMGRTGEAYEEYLKAIDWSRTSGGLRQSRVVFLPAERSAPVPGGSGPRQKKSVAGSAGRGVDRMRWNNGWAAIKGTGY